MIKSDLILFLENVNSLTNFERKKKIYELTNNLDVYLLHDLRFEVHSFYMDKIFEKIYAEGLRIKNVKALKYEDSEEIQHLVFEYEPFTNQAHRRFFDNFMLNYSKIMNSFLEDFELQLFGDVIYNSCEFFEILEELIKREKEPSKKEELGTISEIEEQFEIVEPVDLSYATITERIIYLKLLGVIDFLYDKPPFNSNISSLANVISRITGGGKRHIQSMLNRVLKTKDEEVDEKNPMYSKKVPEVRDKLIEMRFKPYT